MADSCTSWVKFASKCFIEFDAIINGIVFLIELPGCPLLVYGNTADCFCSMLLPRALAEFISANRFCGVGILRISCSSFRMSMNNGAFTLRLSVWVLSVSYIAVARTWGATVDSNGRNQRAEPFSVSANHPAGYGFHEGWSSG